MSREADVVARTAQPVVVGDVVAAMRTVGVKPGDVVMVHSSLSRVGWVVGGPVTIVDGLLAAVGPTGTVVMPAQTGVSDPSLWENPPVPESWWQMIRDEWPVFDSLSTPLRSMGAIVECFHRRGDVARSGHPSTGFVALGAAATELMACQPLSMSLGDESPLAKLYDVDATIVMIGVGHGNNTTLHLAEHRATFAKQIKCDGAPLIVNGRRQWVRYDDLDHDDDDFVQIGDAFVAAGGEQRHALLGNANVTAVRARSIVDFAAAWMSANRPAALQET